MAGATDDEPYSGLVGAFPYAFRASDSWLFRAYVLLGGVLAVLVGLGFAVSLLGVMATTATAGGGTFTFVRAFVIVVGLLVVAPLVAPVLLAARHHRRRGGDTRYDVALAATGYLFVASLYVAVLVTSPPELREAPTGALAPVLAALYGLPRLAGLVPPVAVALLMYLVHRTLR